MRYGYEINPFLRRDEITKWSFKNDDATATPKYGIVMANLSDGRLGCVKAQAGVNADATTALWYASQDVQPDGKAVFFRNAVLPIATGGNPVGSKVYLSATTAGEVTFTAPAPAIVLGHVLGQDSVLIDLTRGGGETTTHLDTHEYWVNSAGAADGRQFTTIEDAMAQAILDTFNIEAVTINIAPGQTHTAPSDSFSARDWTFRGGKIILNGIAFTGTSQRVAFVDTEVTGELVVSTSVKVEWRNVYCPATAEINVSQTTAQTVQVLLDGVTGELAVVQSTSVAGSNLSLTADNCSFKLSANTPTLLTGNRFLVVYKNCAVHSSGTAAPVFDYDTTGPTTAAIVLIGCHVSATGCTLFDNAGPQPNPPGVVITGGHTDVASVGQAFTGAGLPFVDVGSRAGSTMVPADSRVPTYQAGRSVAVYSSTMNAFLGFPNIVEFEFEESVDINSPVTGTMPANGDATALEIPDGETWRVTAHRVVRNGATVYSDKRHFTVYTTGGVTTVQSSAAVDPDPVGVQVGVISVVAGVDNSITVTSTTSTGGIAHVTLEIESALDKAAF